MSATLPRVAHVHHERILRHVDELPALGDAILDAEPGDLAGRLGTTVAFLEGTLLPHVEAAERALYPELERMLQNRHSMTPMRQEHVEVRRLVGILARACAAVADQPLTLGSRLALRRAVFQLYGLLKIHLAEEDAYRHIVEHGVTDEAGAVIAAALDHPVAPPGPVEPPA